MANTNSLYQLFGGYAPKDRVRKIRTIKTPIGKIQFDADLLTKELTEALERDIDKFLEETGKDLNPSTYAKKLFVDDVVRQLKVTGYAGKVEYSPDRALELREEEQVAGVQFTVNLNPYDWYKDPKKETKKLLTEFKNVVNWSDFSGRMEKELLWKPLLEGQTHINKFTDSLFETSKAPYAVMSTGIKAKKILSKTGGGHEVTMLEDVPHACGTTFLEFVSKSQSVASRNGAYLNHVNVSSIAIAQQLQDAISNGTLTRAADIAAAQDFINKQDILRSVVGIHGKGDGQSVFVVNGNPMLTQTEIVSSGLQSALTDISKARLETSVGDVIKTLNDHEKLLRQGSDKILAQIDKKIAYYKAYDPAGLPGFMHFVSPVVGHTYVPGDPSTIGGRMKDIADIRNHLRDASTGMGRPGLTTIQRVEIFGKCKGAISGKMKNFANEGFIGYGSLDVMAKGMAEDLSEGNIAIVLQANSSLITARNMSNVVSQATEIHITESRLDFARAFDKRGPLGIIADYAWDRFRARLDGFTPASQLNEFMQRNHYFGLSYNPAKDGVAYGWAKTLIKGRIFKNTQTITLASGKKFKFDGGNHLEIINDRYFSKFNKDLESTAAATGVVLIIKIDDSDIISILNGGTIPPGLRDKLEQIYDPDTLKDMLAHAAKFKDMLYARRFELGLDFSGGVLVNSAKNQKIVSDLMQSLYNRSKDVNYLSIFNKHAGLLQKLASKLSRFQKFLFDKLGKFLKYLKYLDPITYFKRLGAKYISKYLLAKTAVKGLVSKISTAIATKLAAKIATRAALKAAVGAIAQSLAGAVDAATLGLSTIISHLIAWVITEIVVKILDKLQDVLKSIKNGTFVEDVLEDGAKKFLKTGVITCACCGLCIILPVMFMFEIFFAAITPIDTTRMSVGDGVFGPGGGPGSTFVCPSCSAEPSNPACCIYKPGQGCFEWLENSFKVDSTAESAYTILKNAEDVLVSQFGYYVDRLCAEGSILVSWQGSSVGCGYAGDGWIQFGDGACWDYISSNQGKFTYLFAHETGHCYDHRVPAAQKATDKAIAIDGGTLPTYDGAAGACSTSNSADEDLAEIVGNWVMYHTTCRDLPESRDVFWGDWPAHRDAAVSSAFFGEGDDAETPTPPGGTTPIPD